MGAGGFSPRARCGLWVLWCSTSMAGPVRAVYGLRLGAARQSRRTVPTQRSAKALAFRAGKIVGILALYGEGGIRTLDGGLDPHNALAGRRLQPLGHFSGAGQIVPQRPRWSRRRA